MSDLILSTIPSTLTLTAAGQELVLSVAAGSGEANTVANVGGGDAEVFRDKVGVVLNFRTITGTGSITVSENGDVIEISAGAGGEVNTGTNVGGGDAEVFRDKTGVALNFRTITGLGSATVTENGDVVEINVPAVGETNLAANVGAGAGVFRNKTGVTLNLRTLVGLSGTTVVVNGDVIEITAGGTGDVVGPGSATDEAIARFDTTSGKLLQNSLVTVDDSGNFATPGTVVSNGGTFTAASAVSVALVAKGFAAQSAALQEWRNSADTVLASMTFVSAGTRLTTRAGDRLELESGESDSASAIGFVNRTTNTLSTLGSAHTVWENNGVTLLSLASESAGAAVRFHRTSGGDAPVMFARGTNQLAINMVGVANNFDFAFVTGGQFILRGGGVDRGSITVVGSGIQVRTAGSSSPLALSAATTPSVTTPAIELRSETVVGSGLHTTWVTGTATVVALLDRSGDFILVAIDAADNALVDSPELILRANFDSDPTAGVTPTAFDANIKHVLLTGGASPTSKVDFSVNGAVRFTLQSATPAAYTRNATIVEDRTLLASASATILNNNNVIAALIADLQAANLIG